MSQRRLPLTGEALEPPPTPDGVALILALSRVWKAIQERHPEVPSVVLLPAPALRRGVLGHFAPLRWTARREDGRLLHEVVVVAEHLDREPADVVETLLHEAAHALNFERGIRDCSRSQYHNKRFKAAAEELGLAVTQVRHYGFALTVLTSETAGRYRQVIDDLERVMLHRRRARPSTTTPGTGTNGTKTTTRDDKPVNRNRKAVCACGFIIRASRKTLTETTVRCDQCGEPFLSDK